MLLARTGGATRNAPGSEFHTAPDRYIVPLISEDREELKRVRMSLNVVANIAKIDITALGLVDLETLDRVAHQALLAGKAKEP